MKFELIISLLKNDFSQTKHFFLLDDFTQHLVESLPFSLKNYEFISRLGTGGYSTVFKVRSPKFNRIFAAKMSQIHPEFISEDGDLLDPEISALFSLLHPNIIKFYDYFVYQDYLFIILDYCENGTVSDLLEKTKNKPLSQQLFLQIARGVVSGLLYCHKKELAHRDIKTSNIFLDAQNHPILGDFNLSSMQSSNQLVENVCGSPLYLAPEIFLNRPFDAFKADIYALGVTFYQMATGTLPFTEEEILMNPRPEISFTENVSPQLANLILSMLEMNPCKRLSIQEVHTHPFFLLTHRAVFRDTHSMTRSANLMNIKNSLVNTRTANNRSFKSLYFSSTPLKKSQSYKMGYPHSWNPTFQDEDHFSNDNQ